MLNNFPRPSLSFKGVAGGGAIVGLAMAMVFAPPFSFFSAIATTMIYVILTMLLYGAVGVVIDPFGGYVMSTLVLILAYILLLRAVLALRKYAK